MSACVAGAAGPLQPPDRDTATSQSESSRKLMDTIHSMDSRSFGFLDFQNGGSGCLGNSSTAASFVSKEFIQKGIARLRQDLGVGPQSIPYKSDVFCQLGHLHLLLEEYGEALSAYQRYQALSPDSGANASYLYGLGLIYFHFKEHKWAIESFQRVLEVNPAFARTAEVHLRLGVVYKRREEFAKSVEHFEKALSIAGPASFSKLEIQCHLAHLLHLQGQSRQSKERFEGILASKSVPNNIKALTLRQLGWLYHTVPELASPSEDPNTKAIELLNLAIGADPLSGQAWYFLGRCHSTQGRAHEAFMAYQQAIDKSSEDQADIWCSIGMLYHNMGQPRDGLQSYLCAVYLDPGHASAWSDIGCLYEAVAQPVDAFLCYKNSITARNKRPTNRTEPKSPDYVLSRIACLEQYVSSMSQLLQAQPRPLPSLEEAWLSLIPQHIRARQAASVTPILTLSDLHLSSIPSSPLPTLTSSLPLPSPLTAPLSKRQKLLKRRDPIIVSSLGDIWPKSAGIPPHGMSPGDTPGFAFPPGVFPTHINSVPAVLATGMGNGNGSLGAGMESGFNGSENGGMVLSPAPSEQSLSNGCGFPPEMGVVSPMHQLAALRRRNMPGSSSGTTLLENHHPLPDSVRFLASSDAGGEGVVFSPGSSSGLLECSSLVVGVSSQRVCHTKRKRSRSHHPHTVTPSPGDSHHPHTITSSPGDGHNPHIIASSPGDVHYIGAYTNPSSVPYHPGFNIPNRSNIAQVLKMQLDSHSTANMYSASTFGSHNVKSPFSTDLPSDLLKVTPLAMSTGQLEERLSDYLIDDHDNRGCTLGSHGVDRLGNFGERLSKPFSNKSCRKTTRKKASLSNGHCTTLAHRKPLMGSHFAQNAENVSDSSSGISSASTKLSSNQSPSPSRSNRPSSDSISPKISPSPLTSVVDNRFTYPPGQTRRASDESGTGSMDDELLSPIEEPFPSLADEAEYMLQDPDLRPPKPPPLLLPECGRSVDLRPEVPIYQVTSREDAVSRALHSFCSNPALHICMMRGMCSALELNLDLYTSQALINSCPDHEIEVREQMLQAADENWDVSGRKLVWRCESNKSLTTMGEYARYQESVLLGQDDLTLPDNSDPPPSDSQSNRSKPRQRKMLRFGTNVDLSSESKWGVQISELSKLPKFLQVSCPEANLLTHIGYTILGMNSVQLYMKVTGSRTPGHQENNNFCSVNINIGPGTCEWFAVPNQYWGVMHDLCERHKLSFLVGSWWPVLEELYQLDIPVYQFTQLVGDIVWINPGTVHWVQANGVCNNIAWNIGPLTAHQYRMSWERYQWNKVQKVRSIVPMIHLSWNVARTLKVRDATLYNHLRSLLESSLSQSQELLTHLGRAGIPVVWHGKEDGDQAPCCSYCLEELFNILFVLSQKGQNNVYCHKCAGSLKKSFTVLQQYKIEELQDILSSFKLHYS